MRIVPRLSNVVSRLRRDGATTLLMWVVVVVALEVEGRSTTSDSDDLFRIGCVLGLVLLTGYLHRRQQIRWVSAMVRFVGRRLKLRHLPLEIGIDFRLIPPIAAQTPRWLRRLVSAATLFAAVAVPLAPLFPNAARAGLVQVSYTLYLFLLLGLWGLLLVGSRIFLELPMAAIHDMLVRRRKRRTRRRLHREIAALAVALGTLVALAVILPAWVPLALLVIAAFAAAIPALPSAAAPMTFLWRQNKSPMRSISWSRDHALKLLIAGCGALALVMLSQGDRLVPSAIMDAVRDAMPAIRSAQEGDPGMVITPVLGLIFAWSAAVGLIALAVTTMRIAKHRRAFSRAMTSKEVLLLSGPSARAKIRGLAAQLAGGGLALRLAGENPEPDHPHVILDDDQPGDDPGAFDLQWPPRISSAALVDDRWLRLIDRRFKTLHRRRLGVALRHAFQIARQQENPHGEGFWVAPQHWFATGLTRDTGSDDEYHYQDPVLDDRVGPSFQSLISWKTRAWFHSVCRDLEIDLIFVEDGVDQEHFQRVLDAAFEVHDIFGGSEPLLERHLRPVPGVRAAIHEFRLGRPFQSDAYPEPQYEDIGRARILHVFRDRGEEPANEDIPSSYRGQPAPPSQVPSFY